MTTHKAIREALEAGPTEGPWISQQGQNQMVNPGTTIHHGRGWGVYSDADEHGPDGADAAFIAACNPAAIRALLADLDAKTNALERVASIKNQIFGHDWAEIEEAREIARAALKGTP